SALEDELAERLRWGTEDLRRLLGRIGDRLHAGARRATGRHAKLLADADPLPRLKAVEGNDVVDPDAVLAADRIQRLAVFDDVDGIAGLDLDNRRRGGSRRHHLGEMD